MTQNDELQQAREAYNKVLQSGRDILNHAHPGDHSDMYRIQDYVRALEADREKLLKRVGALEAGLRELYAAAVVVERGIPVATEGWHHDLFAATGNAFHLLHMGDGAALLKRVAALEAGMKEITEVDWKPKRIGDGALLESLNNALLETKRIADALLHTGDGETSSDADASDG